MVGLEGGVDGEGLWHCGTDGCQSVSIGGMRFGGGKRDVSFEDSAFASLGG